MFGYETSRSQVGSNGGCSRWFTPVGGEPFNDGCSDYNAGANGQFGLAHGDDGQRGESDADHQREQFPERQHRAVPVVGWQRGGCVEHEPKLADDRQLRADHGEHEPRDGDRRHLRTGVPVRIADDHRHLLIGNPGGNRDGPGADDDNNHDGAANTLSDSFDEPI